MDRGMDNNAMSFPSSPDWKAKYNEVADMLAETRAELDEFHLSSKELEEELERELERTEKAQQDLIQRVARAEQERDDWKSKFVSLQTTHNTTTTSLQRELDTLRQEHQRVKIQLRELEMGNDDLERNERAISSSLADAEGRYSRVLEEKILLEHELLDKANIEEECQRLRDELRDANEEISIIKDQLDAAQERQSKPTHSIESSTPSSTIPDALSTPSDSEENLLSIAAPAGLDLSDFSHAPETPKKHSPSISTPVATTHAVEPRVSLESGSSMLQRAGFQPPRPSLRPPSRLTRSNTVPRHLVSDPGVVFLEPSPPPPVNRLVTRSQTSTAGGGSTMSTRSKGVQMVSEMRARVKVLEQKIHTRVPRMRNISVTNRASSNAMPPPPLPSKAGPSSTSASPVPSIASSSRSIYEERLGNLKPRRRSVDFESPNGRANVGDSSGWVYIHQETPSPKDHEKELRRTSVPSSYRPLPSPLQDSPTAISRSSSALAQTIMPSGIRRSQSRLSDGRCSSAATTTSTASSLLTPSSRPATPTFLPVYSGNLHGGTGPGMKRSSGPGTGAYTQIKQLTPLSVNTTKSPTAERSSPISNLPTRLSTKTLIPGSMSQSRIGKPSGGGSGTGRKDGSSGGNAETNGKHGNQGRSRAGSIWKSGL
ncbi:Nuclear distribution protein nudE 1 [Grifola frondosa]|uniref:Nuclear distribution protein nudE 1 n=1 Tax=Grifola frondosa TaxID=5627 RepID=A0A1C7MQF8_GRIFR|nr:Nuclear distribution protein nudE 1 [Grifola frondosa]